MKMRLIMVVVACAFSLMPAYGEEFEAKVIGVADGDTVTVLHNGHAQKLRLAEIDCPEKKQAFGNAAKKYTAALSFDKVVKVDTSTQDRYGRSIAQIVLPDGRSLNRELVRAGLAWCYRKYSNNPELLTLEQHARQDYDGLWSTPDAIPPWEFRHAAKRNKETGRPLVRI